VFITPAVVAVVKVAALVRLTVPVVTVVAVLPPWQEKPILAAVAVVGLQLVAQGVRASLFYGIPKQAL
jgi:hypothetical protein